MGGRGRFALFVLSRGASWAGGALTLVALPVLVFQRTGDPLLTGLLAACEGLPYLLLGLPAGALVDRWGPRRTMLVATALSAVAMGTVPALDHLGVLSTGHLLVVALVTATCFVFFDAGSFGAVPALVGRARLGAAVSQLSAVSTVVGLAGPAAAGLLLVVLDPVDLLALDAASFALSLLLLAPVRWAEVAAPAGQRLLDGIREGLRHLWDDDVVRVLTLVGTAGSLAGGAVGGLLVVLAAQRYGLTAGDPHLGLLYAAGPAGALAATTVTPSLQRRVGVGVLSASAWAVAGLALAGLAVAPAWWAAAGLLAVWQCAATTAILHAIVVRQTLTPLHLQSRVGTTARTIAWGGQPVGAAVAGAVTASAGLTAGLLLGALCCGAAVVGVALSAVRRSPRLAELSGR